MAQGKGGGPKVRPIADRIADSILITDSGCWEWQRSRDKHGYGHIWIGSRSDGTRRIRQAHRVSYETFKGEIPKGLHLDHLCRNPSCVNPDHLEPVTVHENVVIRGIGGPADQARQTHCKRGHEFTPENTYRHRNKRYCRTCLKATQRNRKKATA